MQARHTPCAPFCSGGYSVQLFPVASSHPATIVTHILQKLNLRDRVQLVVLAYQSGLCEADGSWP